MFQHTKLYLSFLKSQPRLKMFLKFRKFQPRYSYKIYSYEKRVHWQFIRYEAKWLAYGLLNIDPKSGNFLGFLYFCFAKLFLATFAGWYDLIMLF